MKVKIPQNINNLLMEIGEKSVLFKLFLLTKENPDWEVYHNLNDNGYDLVLLKKNSSERIRIEVKTRQRLYTTTTDEKQKKVVHFTITKNEFENSDFIIAYWFEKNYYFIVPTCDLKKTSSNNVPIFKFIVREKSNGTIDEKSKTYLDNWTALFQK